MSYNGVNKDKSNSHIMAVYQSVKHYDVPDTYIVRCIFPKHNIFISYNTWLNIKNGGKKETTGKQQLALFN
jgi:hypothetical protein